MLAPPTGRNDASPAAPTGTSATGPGNRPAHVTLLEALPEPVLLLGDDLRILHANRAAVDLLGPDLANRPVLALIRQPEAIAALERALGLPADARTEARFIHSTPGAQTVFRLVAHRLPGPAAEREVPAGLVLSFLDISHIEEAEQMRRDFVANVSHELRSPLTVLSGFIETLRGAARDDTEARDRFLDIMAQEAQRMNRLVEDLLSLSKVEGSERMRPRDTVVMSDVIHTTIAALRPQMIDGGVRVDYDRGGAGAEDHRLLGDRDQLIQVFHNLVENAIKYGGAGGEVRIEERLLAGAPWITGPVLELRVIDRGEGIDPVHLPRLTERFYRVDTHRSREMGGTGLGLAIVKHIVNRHRGRLLLESARGEGATVTVQLPAL